MNCFLHIGTEKTATTTIQDFLNLNRGRLLKKGFIYTSSAGKKNNRGLPVAAFNLNRRDDFTKSRGIFSNNDLLSFQKDTIIDLEEEIKRISSEQNNELKIIFSSEHIQSRLTSLEEIERLKEILYSFGLKNISIIIYLRNPAEIANSLFSTAIKSGGLIKIPPPPNNPYFNHVCNHRKTLERFAAVFGESAIVPRIFHITEFKNGSIIEDFCHTIGLSIDNSLIIPNNGNKSLSVLGIHILRRINALIPDFIENKPNPLRGNILSHITKHFSDSKYSMPSYLYDEYDSEFHESNEWVREKYFAEKEILFPLRSYPTESKLGISERELDSIVNFIVDIWIAKSRS